MIGCVLSTVRLKLAKRIWLQNTSKIHLLRANMKKDDCEADDCEKELRKAKELRKIKERPVL